MINSGPKKSSIIFLRAKNFTTHSIYKFKELHHTLLPDDLVIKEYLIA
jgi:hypothetical protein